MAGPATLYQAGDHASRPASGSGCVLYSCTDHDLVYRDDGSSWTTFMTLVGGSGGDIATDTIWDAAGDLAVGSGANTAAKLAVGSENKVLTVVSGTPAWRYLVPQPVYAFASTFTSSGTSTAVTTSAYAIGTTLIAAVYADARVCNSITQTNVTWTNRYSGNGNGQYIEIWTGVVAGGAAGTTATFAFTGADTQTCEIYAIDHPAITTATAYNTNTAAATALVTCSAVTTTTTGDLFFWGHCAEGPTSSYGAQSFPNYIGSATGGQNRGGLGYLMTTRIGTWSLSSSAVDWFAAIVKLT